jgi:uncharacterized protein YndB with AHSA1/START domain
MTVSLPKNPIAARVSPRFATSAERVFDAWLDPELAAKFLFATPTGTMVQAEIDPRVGGTFVFTDRRDGEDAGDIGEYLEIDRPRRLVFTLSVDKYSPYVDRIIVDIAPLESGCELTLTHEMNPDMAAFAVRTEAGWTGILARLAETLGEGRRSQSKNDGRLSI